MIQKTNLIFIIPFLFLFSCCLDSEKDLLKDANGGTSTGCGCCDNCETPNIDSGTTDDDDNTSSNNPLDDNFVPPAETLPLSKDFKLVIGATINGIQAEGHTTSDVFVAGKNVVIADFYMCDHEVTQEEFAKYYERYKYRIEEWNEGVGPNYPAYDLNWLDTLVYCNYRSMAEGRTPCYTIDGSTNPKDWGKVPKGDDWETWESWINVTCDFNANGYRLPKYVEWEYAARGGNGLTGYQYKYSGSDNLDEVAVWKAPIMSEVKSKNPNALGIYDLSGNLDEWCWDSYLGVQNRLAPGGYYYFKDDFSFLVSKRHSQIVDGLTRRSPQHGFRVVCTAD